MTVKDPPNRSPLQPRLLATSKSAEPRNSSRAPWWGPEPQKPGGFPQKHGDFTKKTWGFHMISWDVEPMIAKIWISSDVELIYDGN